MHHHVHRPYPRVTPPDQREHLQHLQRIARAVLGVRDVGIERSTTGVLTLRGVALDPPAITEDNQSGKYGDAVEVRRSSRRHGLSVRQTNRYPRHCHWRDVVDMRVELGVQGRAACCSSRRGAAACSYGGHFAGCGHVMLGAGTRHRGV